MFISCFVYFPKVLCIDNNDIDTNLFGSRQSREKHCVPFLSQPATKLAVVRKQSKYNCACAVPCSHPLLLHWCLSLFETVNSFGCPSSAPSFLNEKIFKKKNPKKPCLIIWLIYQILFDFNFIHNISVYIRCIQSTRKARSLSCQPALTQDQTVPSEGTVYTI